MANPIRFPTYNVNTGTAYMIVKNHLNDNSIALQSKILAIEKVANMETLNGITKDELQHALQWLFAHYDFEN